MMGDKQVIIVKEAQDLRFNEEENRILESYVDNPGTFYSTGFRTQTQEAGQQKEGCQSYG